MNKKNKLMIYVIMFVDLLEFGHYRVKSKTFFPLCFLLPLIIHTFKTNSMLSLKTFLNPSFCFSYFACLFAHRYPIFLEYCFVNSVFSPMNFLVFLQKSSCPKLCLFMVLIMFFHVFDDHFDNNIHLDDCSCGRN